MHGWNSVFSGGRVDDQCVDMDKVIAISPIAVTVERNRFSGSSVVAVEMNGADGRSVEKLFSASLKDAGSGAMRQNVILSMRGYCRCFCCWSLRGAHAPDRSCFCRCSR